jgi:hypothetical protein
MPHGMIVLGSVVGLITGIYTLFGKVLNQRPAIWMRRSAIRRDHMLVCVKNSADQDIAILETHVSPPIYALSYSDAIDGCSI